MSAGGLHQTLLPGFDLAEHQRLLTMKRCPGASGEQEDGDAARNEASRDEHWTLH